MLKVRIGYYDFFFSDGCTDEAVQFAKTAYTHLSEEDKKDHREVIIKFDSEEEDEEE